MPLRYLTGTSIATVDNTSAVLAASNDQIIIAPGAARIATGTGASYGIYGEVGAAYIGITVYGMVAGTTGIFLGDTTETNAVTVAAGGSVIGGESEAIVFAGIFASLRNYGMIETLDAGGFDYAVYSTAERTFILNTGTIGGQSEDAAIYTVSAGGTTLINTGVIGAGGSGNNGAIKFNASADDTVWNAGQIFGDVLLGDGDDLFQGGGLVTGTINSDSGDDTVIGGTADEVIRDDDGANWLAGGDGADRVEIGMGLTGGIPAVSHAFGGVLGGADTSASDTLAILGSVGGIGATIFLSTGAATGLVTRVSDNAVIAYVNGFENAVGTPNADAIFGTAAANVIEGANGGDWMVGNGGADRFVFNFAAHADAGDQIRDFRRSEADRIDLTGIDANTATTTNDAFVFRTAHTNNAAGEVVITNFGNSARVDLYVNPDNIVDGTFVVVYGEAGVTNLTVADFLL